MSSVHEGLQDMTAEVRDLRVPPAAAIRARGDRRRRRRLAAVTAAGAVAVITAGVTVAAWPRQRPVPPPPGDQAAASSYALTCVTALPDDPARVRVSLSGDAAETPAAELRRRNFTVVGAGPHDDDRKTTTLFYGPLAVGTATLLRAAVVGDVDMRFEASRDGDRIEMFLGRDPIRIATPTELNQAMAAIGQPTPPPGC